jgi:hypothetical protein
VTAFYGKFRGKVTDNRDPLRQARLSVLVPDVLGETPSWALPCVPFAGPGSGFLALPPVGANIWVEFEGGDPDYPIWSGCFWGPRDALPTDSPDPGVAVWRTPGSAIVLGRAPSSGVAPSPTPLEVRVEDERVVIGRKDRPFVTVRDDAVELDIPPLGLTLSASTKQLTLTSGTATVTIAAGSVEVQNGPTSVKLGTDQVLVKGISIDLTTGAGRIEVSPASVSINNGALEVT